MSNFDQGTQALSNITGSVNRRTKLNVQLVDNLDELNGFKPTPSVKPVYDNKSSDYGMLKDIEVFGEDIFQVVDIAANNDPNTEFSDDQIKEEAKNIISRNVFLLAVPFIYQGNSRLCVTLSNCMSLYYLLSSNINNNPQMLRALNLILENKTYKGLKRSANKTVNQNFFTNYFNNEGRILTGVTKFVQSPTDHTAVDRYSDYKVEANGRSLSIDDIISFLSTYRTPLVIRTCSTRFFKYTTIKNSELNSKGIVYQISLKAPQTQDGHTVIIIGYVTLQDGSKGLILNDPGTYRGSKIMLLEQDWNRARGHWVRGHNNIPMELGNKTSRKHVNNVNK